MPRVLVIGTAGFIGFYLVQLLLVQGQQVDGYDAMTNYYVVALKKARRDILLATPGYSDTVAMLEDMAALTTAAEEFQSQMIVHLAVQAGVR